MSPLGINIEAGCNVTGPVIRRFHSESHMNAEGEQTYLVEQLLKEYSRYYWIVLNHAIDGGNVTVWKTKISNGKLLSTAQWEVLHDRTQLGCKDRDLELMDPNVTIHPYKLTT